jgi:hypothetical protein
MLLAAGSLFAGVNTKGYFQIDTTERAPDPFTESDM